MALTSLITILAAAATTAHGAALHRRDDTQPVGTNPVGGFTVQHLGYQTADNSCSHRDLGFAGHIAGSWYAVYGDTLWCAAGVTDPDNDPSGFHGMVRDSVSALGSNPLSVHDLDLNGDTPVPHQNQFVPFNASWGETNSYGFGGTSIVETDADTATGAVYYLVNDNNNNYKGGVGKVQVLAGTPKVTHRYGAQGYWWDGATVPHYGDVAAYRDINSDYIYILGNPPNSQSGFPDSSYVYQARVSAADAFDESQYMYWWGRSEGWKADVLTTFTSDTAVMWGVGQGQMVWSAHFSTYLYVHMGVGDNTFYLRAAPSPQGPWTADKAIYTITPVDSSLAGYAGVAYPYLDNTGKTLTMACTNSNHIEVIKVTFS